MGKISNVFTMLELLNNRKKYSIKELSERLEVNNRMVRLYKEELEKAGIYIDTIRGPYGGYILNRSVILQPRAFSKYDIDLMNNVYKLIKNDERFILHKEYLNLIDKVTGVYQGSKKKTDSIKINNNDDEKKKYNILNKAIKEHCKVWINFISADGTNKERIIHPCDMFFYSDSWYISAFCELRSEIRHFRLARIIEYKLLEEKY
jgi:predicted DNA-binding transcriptional regulator YafY